MDKSRQPSDTLNLLEKRLEDLRRQLEEAAPRLMREYEATEQALKAISERYKPRIGEYTWYRSGVAALEAYLQRNGPTKRQDACKAVADGGWSFGDINAYWRLIEVVRNQIDKAPKPRIFMVGDNVIGLAEHRPEQETPKPKVLEYP